MGIDRKYLMIPDSVKEILDDEQQNAVRMPISDICVSAIAGSGKTRVLTCRVATLIYNGYLEDSIILLTFTNKASDEIIRRVGELIPNCHIDMLYGTFHSICCHFLRKYHSKLGLSDNFGVVRPQEQTILMQHFRNEHIHIYFEDDDTKLPSGAVLCEIYTSAINKNIPFFEYIKSNYSGRIPVESISNIIDFFESYEKYKEVNNKIDYDGMLLYFYDLLNFFPDVREEINAQYKHILVDEYQDINWLQHDILQLLNSNSSLFSIGDVSQCIYQFRGSEPRYIIDYNKTYPNAYMLQLSHNYRSCDSILKFAEDSINHNGINVTINSVFKNPYLPEVRPFKAPEDEADYIAKDILSKYKSELSKVAVLTRTSKQLMLINEALKNNGIKVNTLKDDLFEFKCIRRLFALLFFCENPNEILYIKDALVSFCGVGEKQASDIIEQYINNGRNLSKVKPKTSSMKNALTQLINLNTAIKSSYGNVRHMHLDIYINVIMDRFLRSELSDKETKLITALCKCAGKYKLVINLYDDLKKEKIHLFSQQTSVSVLTMHSAKGLEWDYVYLPFITNNVFPKCPFWELDKNTDFIKAERNLFYVAVTRAKERLYISYSTESNNPKYHAGPSIFIKELNRELYSYNKK